MWSKLLSISTQYKGYTAIISNAIVVCGGQWNSILLLHSLGTSLKNLNNCSYNHGQLINDQENQDRCKTKRSRIPTCIYKIYHYGDHEGTQAGRPVPLCFCKCVINDRELVAPPNPHHCMNIQNAPFKYTNVIGFFHWLALSL